MNEAILGKADSDIVKALNNTDNEELTVKSFYFERRAFNLKQIRPRKINFKFDNDIPKLWLGNSIVMTHFFNGLNLYLPAFESSMARIIQKYSKNVQDKNLRQQIYGFIGQEKSHAQTHHKYNQILVAQGYKIEGYLKLAKFFFVDVLEKTLGAKASLATVAGFEHLTVLLTDIVLNQNIMKNATPIMKELWEWHAAEEVEHKNIAFELLQTVDNSYWLRILGLFLGAIILIFFSFYGMFILALQEKNFFSRKTVVDLYKLLLGENKLVLKGFKVFVQYFKLNIVSLHNNYVPLAEQVFNN